MHISLSLLIIICNTSQSFSCLNINPGLSKAASLYAPFFLATATNSLVIGDYKEAVNGMVGFCILRFLSSFLKECQSIFYIKVKQQASIELQVMTFKHLHNLSLTWHLTKKTGSVMKSMDRGVEASNMLITYLFLFLIPAMAECLAVVILFFSNFQQWALGVLVFAGVLSYSFVTIFITQWRKKFREGTNKTDNDLHDKAQDSILNFETVKYFTAEEFEVSRFKKSVVAFQSFNASTALSMSLLNISQQFLMIGTLLGALLLAGKAVTQHEMSLGDWVAVNMWVTQIFVPLNFLGSVYSMIVQSLVDIKNLSELLSESPDIVDDPGAKDLVLYDTPSSGVSAANVDIEMQAVKDKSYKGAKVEFKDIHFNYPEQPIEKGLKGVSFSIEPGTTTAIVGSTGAGKTTISRLLFRFYDPKSGSVSIGGKDIKHFTQQSIRKLVGIVPQDTVLFNDTVMYNIRYGRMDATDEEVHAAAGAAQIKTFIESLPESWDTTVGERGLKLSGGEKQRVAIARCLLKNPPIVILDEATSALDTVTENSVQEALNALGSNRTVLIIAHRLSTIRDANQIIVMDNGLISEIGTHADLLRNPDSHYAKLWNMQLRVT